MAILFSHPKDYTPVCTTEFGAVAQLAKEWEAHNTKVVGLSVDGVEEHKGWKKDIEAVSGAKAVFPIIADASLEVSNNLICCQQMPICQMAARQLILPLFGLSLSSARTRNCSYP